MIQAKLEAPKALGAEAADADALDAFMSNVETELENDKACAACSAYCARHHCLHAPLLDLLDTIHTCSQKHIDKWIVRKFMDQRVRID